MPIDISELIAALSDPDRNRRLQAAQQLAGMGDQARPAAVPLVRLCGDEDEPIREWTMAALEAMGPPSAADAEALSESLGDANADVGYWSATLLGRLGAPGAVAAVEPLAKALLHSPHAAVRHRAAWALGKIGPSAAGSLPALKKSAAWDDPRLARLAQQAVEQIQR
jgi:HEAT repeat protein